MTQAVDARWMVGQYRGMGHYARALLEPLASGTLALLPEGYPSASYPTVRAGAGFFPYWEQVVLPKLCGDHAVSRLLCPYNTAPLRLPPSVELTLVVHDLIYLEPWSRLPPSVSAYQTLGRVYRRLVVPHAVRHAARLVAVSEFTRNELVEKFSISPQCVHVIPNSLEDVWYVESPLTVELRKPYVLAVAGEAPSKNLSALIHAFSAFRRMAGKSAEDSTLRVVGVKLGYQRHFLRVAEGAGVAACIVFEPFLDENALRQLYREATLFVMPSLYEGFGIPLLEAMASGTPVVSSNTTSMPEVVGETGWLFDPRDVNDMSEKLHSAWLDEEARSELAVQGLVRARRFSRAVVAETIKHFWGNV